MAITEKLHTTTGTASDTYSFPFPYFKESDVVVEIDNVIQDQSTKYTFHTATEIKFTSGNIPASGKALKIYRDTNVDNAKAVFSTGSSIRATDLNNNFDQTLYSDQELVYTKDITSEAVTSAKIRNLTIVNEDISTTAEIDVSKLADGSARQIIQTAANGNDVEWTSNVDVPGTLDVTGATDLDGTLNVDGATTLAATTATTLSTTGNTTIGGNLDVTGTFDVTGTSNYTGQQTVPGGALVKNIRVGLDNPNEVSTASGSLILDSNTGTVEITDHLNVTGNADVDNNLNVDGSITVDGTVDGRDVAADGTKLDAIEASATADQTAAEIRVLVEAADNSNVFTNADHSKLDAIDNNAKDDQTAAEIRVLVEAADNSNVFTDADHTKLNAIEASATADQTAAEIKTAYESNSDTNPLTDAEKAVIDGVTANTSELNILDGVTSSTAELNLLDGKSIVTSIASNATDVQLPSAQAVNERITSIVSDVGGFVPVADELKFPNANPDPDGDAGTIVSIADAGGIEVGDGNGGTVAGRSTTARSLDGSTITINNIDSSLHGTTIAAGKGMLVETTDTTHTYNYHRLVVDEAGVASAQTLVTDFNQRYRVGATNPSSSLDDGDLFFNTTSNKMLVYNETGSSWDEVAGSSGNFTICSLTSVGSSGDSPPGGSATFNGTAQKFGLTGAGSAAQQHLVSINGVIQKPNTGSSVPSEGFALDGSTIIFSTAPANGSDFFIVAIGKSVEIGTPSNNSITSAMIIDGSITGGDIASDTITEDKLDIHAAPSGTNKFLGYTSNGLEWAVPPDTNTTVGGATGVDFNDGVKARWGTGNDLEIYHDSGGNTFIKETGSGSLVINADDFYLQDVATNTQIKSVSGGAVELYHNGTKKFQTTSSGVHCFGQLEMDGSNNIDLQDNGAILLGNSDDLQIFHDGSNSVIREAGDGDLYFQSDGTFFFRKVTSAEDMAKFIQDGAVELYYDNSKKLETFSWGIQNYGNVAFRDSDKATFGGAEDLKIYHDGSNTYLQNATNTLYIKGDALRIRSYSVNEMQISADVNGTVALAYDGVQKFETTSGGAKVTGNLEVTSYISQDDSIWHYWGTGDDCGIMHDGNNMVIRTGTGNLRLEPKGGELGVLAIPDGAVELYYDNSKKFETNSTGIRISPGGSSSTVNLSTTTSSDKFLFAANKDGTDATTLAFKVQASGGSSVEKLEINSTGAKVTDTNKFVAGTGDDLEIYHDGSNSFIKGSGTGNLAIQSNGTSSVILQPVAGENSVVANSNGSVDLYYDGGKKFETKSDGALVDGDLWINTGGTIKTNSSQGQLTIKGGATYPGGAIKFAGGQDGATDQGTSIFYAGEATSLEERLRITKDGSLFHGCTTAPDSDDPGSAFMADANQGQLRIATNSSGWAVLCTFYNANGNVGDIRTNASATSYNTSSDYRLKENEVAISDGITRLKTLKPYRFNFKADSSKIVDGFFAHEVTAVPEAITGEKDGTEMQGIDQSKLVPLLTAALQEAITKIETLETKVAALEAK